MRFMLSLLAPLVLMQTQTCGPAPEPEPPPQPAPSPDPVPQPTDVYEDACANEKKLGCEPHDNCAEVFRHAVEAQITVVSEATAQCIAKATSKEAVRSCGYASCP